MNDILQLCRKYGLTQRQLAALAGIREETVSRLVNKKSNPHPNTLCKIYRAVDKKYKHPGYKTPFAKKALQCGYCIEDLAKLLNVSRPTIRMLMCRQNRPIRLRTIRRAMWLFNLTYDETLTIFSNTFKALNPSIYDLLIYKLKLFYSLLELSEIYYIHPGNVMNALAGTAKGEGFRWKVIKFLGLPRQAEFYDLVFGELDAAH